MHWSSSCSLVVLLVGGCQWERTTPLPAMPAPVRQFTGYSDTVATILADVVTEQGRPSVTEEEKDVANQAHGYFAGLTNEARRLLTDAGGRDPYQVLNEYRNKAEPFLDGSKWIEWSRREQQAWDQHIQPYLKERFIEKLGMRKALFDRKYFHSPEDDAGNFIEGFLNSRFDIFKLDDSYGSNPAEDPWYRYRGVSQLEMLARIQPAIAFDDGNRASALATLGLVHHFFPETEATKFDVRTTDDIWSKYVKRVGLSLGAGVQDRSTGGADFIAGVGLQVSSFTVWGLYNPQDSEFFLGVGAGDFEWAQSVLPKW